MRPEEKQVCDPRDNAALAMGGIILFLLGQSALRAATLH